MHYIEKIAEVRKELDEKYSERKIKHDEIVIVTECKCGNITEYSELEINEGCLQKNDNYEPICIKCENMAKYVFLHNKYKHFVDEKWKILKESNCYEISNYGRIRIKKSKKIKRLYLSNGYLYLYCKKEFYNIKKLQKKYFNQIIDIKTDNIIKKDKPKKTKSKTKKTLKKYSANEINNLKKIIGHIGFNKIGKMSGIKSLYHKLNTISIKEDEYNSLLQFLKSKEFETFKKENENKNVKIEYEKAKNEFNKIKKVLKINNIKFYNLKKIRNKKNIKSLLSFSQAIYSGNGLTKQTLINSKKTLEYFCKCSK